MIVQHLTLPTPTSLPPLARPLVLSIGNFDGVHLGHQAMINTAKRLARTQNKATAVLVFEPQPKEFFAPANAPARLSSLPEKCLLLEALGVDCVFVARFDDAFAQQSATQFCQWLKHWHVSDLVLGHDFRFGYGRTGDRHTLKNFGFDIHCPADICQNGLRLSSTAIRQALAQKDLAAAGRYLGRNYTMMGQVVPGDKIGRNLGFPTANIALERLLPAIRGIWGANVTLLDGQYRPMNFVPLAGGGYAGTKPQTLFGCVNIGTRPSIDGEQWRFEVHLPDFAGDLYGQHLAVEFLTFLHDDKHYPHLNALKTGIANDVAALLAWRQKIC